MQASEPTNSRVAAKGTVRLLIGRALFMLSGYVIAVLLARGLGPVAYGVYGVIMSVLLWAEVTSDMGVVRATIRLIPEANDPRAFAAVCAAILTGISVALFAVGWFAAPSLAAALEIEHGTALIRIAILDLPFNGLYLAYQGYLQGTRQFGTLSVAMIVYSLAKVAGTCALVLVGFSVEAALIVNVLATIAALAFLTLRYRLVPRMPDRRLTGVIVRVAVPLGIYVAAMQLLLSLHLWMLQRMDVVPEQVIGHYVAALNLAKLPTAVTFVLTGVVLASITTALAARNHALARRYLQAAIRFSLVVLAPVLVLGAIDARTIMELVFSSAYATGGPLLAWMLAGYCILSVLDTLIQALIADGRYRQLTIGLIAMIPVAVLLNVLLISQLGASGAAIAFMLTLLIATLLVGVAVALRFGSPVSLPVLLRVGAATAAVGLISTRFPVDVLWLIPKLGMLMLVYAVVLGLLRELTADDVRPFAVWKKG